MATVKGTHISFFLLKGYCAIDSICFSSSQYNTEARYHMYLHMTFSGRQRGFVDKVPRPEGRDRSVNE